MGFFKYVDDGCLLIRVNNIRTVILCIYGNKMIVVGDKEAIEAFKQESKQFFNTKEERTMKEIRRIQGNQEGQ